MTHGQLVSQSDTDRVTRAELRALPMPVATSTFKPIPHIDLIESLEKILQQNQMAISEEQFALRRDGSALFAVIKLAYSESPDGTAALGLRTANNRTMSIQICAGLSVFVCSNMAFRGDLIALRRKHTSGLNLREELFSAVRRFRDHFTQLVTEVDSLKNRQLSTIEAKALIHDAFAQQLMPVRFLPYVSSAYFKPMNEEFQPRNAWSLHNAFTGVAKEMPMSTRLSAIQDLGKLFGMVGKAEPTALAA